jgi:hypothetical protein
MSTTNRKKSFQDDFPYRVTLQETREYVENWNKIKRWCDDRYEESGWDWWPSRTENATIYGFTSDEHKLEFILTWK